MPLQLAQAATPEFFALQRGEIFGSALDIMATQQSMYEDEPGQHLTATQTDLLGSTVHTHAAIPVRAPQPSVFVAALTVSVLAFAGLRTLNLTMDRPRFM